MSEEIDMMDSSGCANSEPFALRVLGDSMEPEFKDGCVVIIDPDGTAESGKYVIAELEGEYIFRQFVQEQDRFYLKPVNPGYKSVEVASPAVVRGVITQQAGMRRKDHKRYE